MSVAATAAALGLTPAMAYGLTDGSAASTGTSAEPPWVLVDDPAGLFTPPPIEARAQQADADHVITIPYAEVPGLQVNALRTNTLDITDVAATSRGLLAVGNETVDFTDRGVLWQSPDGQAWKRVELGDVVNVGTFTGAAGPGLRAIAEYGGRTVLIGEHSTYISDDLETWERGDGLESDPQGWSFWSAAAGPDGFVAVGLGAWYSADGMAWEETIDAGSVPEPIGSSVHDVIFDGEQFVAAGLSPEEDGAAVWTSPDGRDWERRPLARGEAPQEDPWPVSIAHRDGVHVIVGTEFEASAATPVGWRSDDGGATWTPIGFPTPEVDERYATVVVATDSEFVILTSDDPESEGGNVEYRSPDGVEWTEHAIELPGYRTAATAFGDGAVAVGQAGPQLGAANAEPPPSVVDGTIAAPPSATASVWTLGLPPP